MEETPQPPSQFPDVHVLRVPRESALSPDKLELLARILPFLDRLDELEPDEQGQPSESSEISRAEAEELEALANRYIVRFHGGLPLWEVFRGQPQRSGRAGWHLGYRLNALEAVFLPGYLDAPWSQEASRFDQICWVLASGDDLFEDSCVLSEEVGTLPIRTVQGRRLADQKHWDLIHSALQRGPGVLPRVVPVTHNLLSLWNGTPWATTVAELMDQAVSRQSYQPEDMSAYASTPEDRQFWAQRYQEELAEIDEKRQRRNRIQETWSALLQAHEQGESLLRAWIELEGDPGDDERGHTRLVVLNFRFYEEELIAYRERHPELELEEPKKKSNWLSGGELKPMHGANPGAQPGDGARLATEPTPPRSPQQWLQSWEARRYRGKWVVLDPDCFGVWSEERRERVVEVISMAGKGWAGWVIQLPDEGRPLEEANIFPVDEFVGAD